MRGKFANWDRWLTEEERPGFSEVEAIADFTHVPVGYLFLSEPPQEELPIPDFRAGRGPDVAPSGDLLETIYLNQRRQGWYEDYLTEFGDADPLPFVGSARHASVERAADMIRKELNYGIEVRLRMRSIDEVRTHLIESFEALGGLVVLNSIVENNTHRPLDIDEFRGFTLHSVTAPLVFVNVRDTKRGQVFSLLHEFAHVWRGESGVSAGGEPLRGHSDRVERWCDAVAAEIAAPVADLRSQFDSGIGLAEELERLADRYRCSALVVLIRLRDTGLVGREGFQNIYDAEVDRLRKAAERIPRGGGGDFYNNQPFRVGRTLSRAIIRDTMHGSTSMTEALRLLSFKRAPMFDEYAILLGLRPRFRLLRVSSTCRPRSAVPRSTPPISTRRGDLC